MQIIGTTVLDDLSFLGYGTCIRDVKMRPEEQLDDNVRTWLANPQLNEFVPTQRLARVSSIFKWYSGDFEPTGGLNPFLARFAPTRRADFLRGPDAKIEFKTYNWV